MRKRIWIVNYYTGTPESVANPRYLEFSHYFREAGYDVITFNADYTCDCQVPLFNKRNYGDYKYVHVKVPHYEGNGLRRMYSIFMFAWLICRHVHQFDKPDLILHNVHAPFDFPIAWAAKRVNAKYVTEVWDLWPDNFVNFGLVSANNPMMKLFYRIERWIYCQADQLVFTMLGALSYLREKGWTVESGGKIDLARCHYINNGVELARFDADRIAYPRADEDLNNDAVFKIIYIGTISFANHVETLIDAAALLQADGKYQFFIYGDGSNRAQLEKYVESHHINNVHFKEKLIPLCEVAWVVSQATVNVMTYEKGFGYMGISSGKLFQYLAAGKPIVCNITISYDDVITDNSIGVAQDMDSPEEFARSVRQLVEQPKAEYEAMCRRVRTVAERFDYKKLSAEELSVIESCF